MYGDRVYLRPRTLAEPRRASASPRLRTALTSAPFSTTNGSG